MIVQILKRHVCRFDTWKLHSKITLTKMYDILYNAEPEMFNSHLIYLPFLCYIDHTEPSPGNCVTTPHSFIMRHLRNLDHFNYPVTGHQ